MNGQICITLKSDLCATSGDGFSLSIDTDVCADKYGLPFIPSRRIKGCMRDAAEYIGISAEKIDRIFGIRGAISAGTLKLKNARLENYEALKTQALNSDYSSEKILTLFTSVRASTAVHGIDDRDENNNDICGTAVENSLRFTRVVNHYSPIDESELKFTADADYEDVDTETLEMICKALRHIGYKQTRGLGSVSCCFKPVLGEDKEDKIKPIVPNGEELYDLRYTVKLNSPAAFAGKSSVQTLDYIPGSAVIGAFAANYLKRNDADEDFEKLFLTDRLCFSNLYLSDGKTVSQPAPTVLGKAKGSKEIRFIFREDNDENALTPKAFKNGYLIGSDETKPATEIIYHHRHKKKDTDALLYTQECLCEKQLFSGGIRGKGCDLRKLFSTFEIGELNLGRSKSAQYSACDIVSAEITPVSKETISEKVYALLCSDVILLDDNAAFYTNANVLASALSLDADMTHSSLGYTTVMGYVSAGRYKRSHIRGFKKGSVICGTLKQQTTKYITIGERQNEGFGVIKFCTKEELLKLGTAAPKLCDLPESSAVSALNELINTNDTIEKMRMTALDYADKKFNDVKWIFNPAFVGRLSMMNSQAKNFDDLIERVNSIKTEKKRTAAIEFINNAESDCTEKVDKNVWETYWRDFIGISLTIIKYRLKKEN